MKLRYIKYGLPLLLTLLYGLFLVHSNLKVKDTTAIHLAETFLQPNDTNPFASVGAYPRSCDKRLAVEVAESEEQEEEIKHVISSEDDRLLGNSPTSSLYARALGYSLYKSKNSSAQLKALGINFPFSRYIRFQVFRL